MNNNDARIVKNDAGIYEIRFGGKRSKRKSTGTTDLREAYAFYGRWMITKDQAKVVDVSKILDDYMAEHVSQKVVSTERQEDCVAVLKAGLGSKLVTDLDSQVMLKYREDRRAGKINGREVGDGTLRRELNCLVAAINHAVRQRRLSSADVPHIDLPAAPAPKDLWLTGEQLDKLIAVSASTYGDMSRIHRFIVIASETASRKTSVVELRWSQVDFERGLINFQNDGKARTKKRRVPVPMSSRLKAFLERAWIARTQDEWVLDTPYSIQHHFEAVVKAAGLEDVTPHTLRHTWATLAAQAGVELFQIAGVLGDCLATVMRVYAHHCPDHLRGAVNFRDQST
jgi:integrase